MPSFKMSVVSKTSLVLFSQLTKLSFVWSLVRDVLFKVWILCLCKFTKQHFEYIGSRHIFDSVKKNPSSSKINMHSVYFCV